MTNSDESSPYFRSLADWLRLGYVDADDVRTECDHCGRRLTMVEVLLGSQNCVESAELGIILPEMFEELLDTNDVLKNENDHLRKGIVCLKDKIDRLEYDNDRQRQTIETQVKSVSTAASKLLTQQAEIKKLSNTVRSIAEVLRDYVDK